MSSNDISIQFLGAAGTVTGSKHLLKTPEKNILIDCGLFQGLKSLRLKNRESLPVIVSDIHIVILTHAHLDHCGYIPLLLKSGFKGKILMTPPTRDLAEIILRDSAKIQEEDAERENRLGLSKHNPSLPLYTVKSVEIALKQFYVYSDNEWISISPNIEFRFIKNGHILGSCFVEINCFGKKIVFSGDIGRNKDEIMNPPSIIEEADFLVMESTYGDRLHGTALAKDELADIINDTIHQNGNLVIPSFAVGRAQELMHLVNQLKKEIRIPNVPVFMDSPMGADATKVLHRYPAWHKLTEEQCHSVCHDINIITDFHDTLKIIALKGSKIIIAASGMITGGRVLEYLKNYIEDKKNTVLLVGYQAEGTRGRALRNRAFEIKMYGKYYKVNARVKEISSLSAHADQQEMIGWMKQIKNKLQKIFLVHGEPQAQEAFRVKISDELMVQPILPKQNEEYILFSV
ncbi:MAG: MBL fold metallo-hydrolase [Bacteroidetes bacterium]|nr:MAG: MBL fold metallo-hydrolase [Bacteroidota bacterium]